MFDMIDVLLILPCLVVFLGFHDFGIKDGECHGIGSEEHEPAAKTIFIGFLRDAIALNQQVMIPHVFGKVV